MDTVQILKDARALIADEKNWTRGTYSRDQYGECVEPSSKEAACFCSLGALAKASNAVELEETLDGEAVLVSLVYEEGFVDVASFNDSHSHAQGLNLFDRAIARAESEAA